MELHLQARRRACQHGEGGYVLLTLLLMVALMIMFAAAIVPSITFEIKRDREEEMIHRGVQYSRAIRAYYKKFGRYPTKLEDLESANNLRFLRKRYKDPITGKDFRLLHFGEVQLTLSGALGGGGIPGASSLNSATPFGSTAAQPGGLNAGGGFLSSGNGENSNTASGNNSNTPADQSQNGSPDAGSQVPGQKDQGAVSGDQLSTHVFGGGPIVGVASTNKGATIREFNHKRKYNEWQFIYDPALDRGGLIMTPNQPQLQAFGQPGVQNVNGQNGSSSFGTGNSFGTSPAGLQNNPNSQSGGFGTPNQPSSPPQQQ